MNNELFAKYEHLKHLIKSFGRVGIAFSGGVDSTLLLHAACEVLPGERIVALHGRSILNISESNIEDLYEQCFSGKAQLEIIQLKPLSLPEFVNNDSKRCYYCKRKTYTTFLGFLESVDTTILLDGTNVDDLSEPRAGLKVLEELSIKTPLVDAGIGKKEIRFLAKSFDLPNYNMPSNSCLATRLVFTPEITADGLKQVEKIEIKLKKMGYVGCRVKPIRKNLILEIQQHHFDKISKRHSRLEIIRMCRKFGFNKVFLDINGR